MEMTKGEIVRNYREAKDPREQITILAQLNLCDVDDIKQILKEAGEKLPRGRMPRKNATTEVKSKKPVPDSPLLMKDVKEAVATLKTPSPIVAPVAATNATTNTTTTTTKPAPYKQWVRARQQDIAAYLRDALARLYVLDEELLSEYQDLARIDTLKPQHPES